LVLLEAMAAGLPVLAQAEMGTVDILAPGRGAWVLPNDSVAFGAQLGAFLNDPGLWPGMAQEAKAYAASWSDAAMGVRLAGLYEQLCGRLGAAPAGLAAAST
jgi:glycosyltransferase involved in cell wall biosynthesis